MQESVTRAPPTAGPGRLSSLPVACLRLLKPQHNEKFYGSLLGLMIHPPRAASRRFNAALRLIGNTFSLLGVLPRWQEVVGARGFSPGNPCSPQRKGSKMTQCWLLVLPLLGSVVISFLLSPPLRLRLHPVAKLAAAAAAAAAASDAFRVGFKAWFGRGLKRGSNRRSVQAAGTCRRRHKSGPARHRSA